LHISNNELKIRVKEFLKFATAKY